MFLSDHYKSDSNRALDAEATSQGVGTEGENWGKMPGFIILRWDKNGQADANIHECSNIILNVWPDDTVNVPWRF